VDPEGQDLGSMVLEPFKFVVIQLGEIAGGAVVQELEDLVHVFASTLDNSLREKCDQRLQGLEPWGPKSATRHVPKVGHTLWCPPGYLCINLLAVRRIE
jgi:hypothetical protein